MWEVYSVETKSVFLELTTLEVASSFVQMLHRAQGAPAVKAKRKFVVHRVRYCSHCGKRLWPSEVIPIMQECFKKGEDISNDKFVCCSCR